MDQFYDQFRQRLARTDTRFVRSIMHHIQWDARLIGIKGSRGVGKTTLILQYIKLHLMSELDSTLYVSLDHIWFSEHRFIHLVDAFYKRGGKYLFLDEVHKYQDWSVEIKNIHDLYPDLRVVFTGSSLLEILNARADLSRRAIIYNMQGLSFREYIELVSGHIFHPFTLSDIINEHTAISDQVLSKIRPFKFFKDYLQYGYYPFFTEQKELYNSRLEEVVNMILEIELPQLRNVNIAFVMKLKRLLLIISQSAPFIPNISKLSERIGINRETLLTYLWHLSEANLVYPLYRDSFGISKLQKPDKLYLENTNLMVVLGGESVNMGNIRETFFLNQFKYIHKLEFTERGDFLVDSKYTFEIGGKNKKNKQIREVADSFIVSDDIEYGNGNRIPIWLFGFLY